MSNTPRTDAVHYRTYDDPLHDCVFAHVKLAHELERELQAMTAAKNKALRLAIAEHDWRRGYAGPCPLDLRCPTCKLIAELEAIK